MIWAALTVAVTLLLGMLSGPQIFAEYEFIKDYNTAAGVVNSVAPRGFYGCSIQFKEGQKEYIIQRSDCRDLPIGGSVNVFYSDREKDLFFIRDPIGLLREDIIGFFVYVLSYLLL